MTSLELSELPLLRNLTMESGELPGLQEFALKGFPSLTSVVVKAHFAALSRFELESMGLNLLFQPDLPSLQFLAVNAPLPNDPSFLLHNMTAETICIQGATNENVSFFEMDSVAVRTFLIGNEHKEGTLTNVLRATFDSVSQLETFVLGKKAFTAVRSFTLPDESLKTLVLGDEVLQRSERLVLRRSEEEG